ncbi:T9SS type A sorting domain-containing protein [Chryseobacterium sp. NFX27]|uniref:T9SS type A sorting domain-containing protein n=1 Tax=Chryseobacterium sp. NFX27 TaxID=2819618 RepID=UPI003CF4EAB2
MKTYLFMYCLRAAVLCILFIFLSNTYNAQGKTYANSQTVATQGVCACEITSPNDAVGSNEDDFSTLKINLGVAATMEQTLHFPSTVSFSKLVVGIGNSSSPLSVQLLKGITVETMNGGAPNGDVQTIDGNLLKLGAQGANRATIEINTKKYYNAVKIKLNGGLLNLNDGLRIYYAHQVPDVFASACTALPFRPTAYYPFNENLTNILPGYNFASVGAVPPFFADMICNKGLTASGSPSTIKVKDTQSPQADGYTISFWAKTASAQNGNPPPSITIDAFAMTSRILPDAIKLNLTPPTFGLTPSLGDNLEAPSINTQFDHYVIRYSKNTDAQRAIIFKNGQHTGVNLLWGGFDTLHAFHTDINITLDRAQIDEFIIYNKALTAEEMEVLFKVYPAPQNIPTGSFGKTTDSDEIFTISPNPTSGQINIGRNITYSDALVSVKSLSGKEVFRSKLRSHTFDLPSNLAGGIYVVLLQTTDKKIYTGKVILTR